MGPRSTLFWALAGLLRSLLGCLMDPPSPPFELLATKLSTVCSNVRRHLRQALVPAKAAGPWGWVWDSSQLYQSDTSLITGCWREEGLC